MGHGIYELENDVKLVFEIMEKKLEVLFGMPSDIRNRRSDTVFKET